MSNKTRSKFDFGEMKASRRASTHSRTQSLTLYPRPSLRFSELIIQNGSSPLKSFYLTTELLLALSLLSLNKLIPLEGKHSGVKQS